MQLILSGNPNLNSIQNVVYLANEYFDQCIEKVHFIDNEHTLRDREGGKIEAERNNFVRECISGVQVTSTQISLSKKHLRIPQILSRELEIYSRNEIIVDLTNGTKSISSVLYASASLSKIPHLFFLSIDREKRSEPPESLQEDEYTVDTLPALENIGEIGKYSYFEIVYYLERITNLTSEVDNSVLTDEYLIRSMEDELQRAVRSYFREEYANCIQKIGQVMESLSWELANAIRNEAKGSITNSVDTGFSETNTWIRTEFCDKLRGKLDSGEDLKDYEDRLCDLANVDKILETVRVYRNVSSHGNSILRGGEEAKLIMSNAMYVLEIVNESSILS